MELSNRLKAICDLCHKGNTVADIGCDHGYVSITLTNNRIFDRALAMDINEGPLRLAAQNIRFFGDGSRIETRLSNGLEKLEENEADAIIIAGMGGILVRDILAAGQSKLKGVKQLILGAQSDLDLVRSYLREIRFCIEDENMILEDGKYYQIIKAVPYCKDNISVSSDMVFDSVSAKAIDKYGPVLLASKNEVLYKYLLHNKKVTEEIISNLLVKLAKSNDDRMASRVEELRTELSVIDNALGMFKE